MVRRPSAPATTADQVRLMTTIAWLYHSRHLRQAAIAQRLSISQSRVSRLLDQAVTAGIVQTALVLPAQAGSTLEAELEATYHLDAAHVYDLGEGIHESQLVPELGQLLALHLQSMSLDDPVIGFSSWSRTLREAVKSLRALRQARTSYVVEMLGDLGSPALQHESTHLTRHLADMTGATAMFLRIPGVAPEAEIARVRLDHDQHAQATLRMLDEMDLALLGVGTADPAGPVQTGGSFFTQAQLARARERGAVAELNLRFLDADGAPVDAELDDLVVGATLDQLRRARRRVAVAGGARKHVAIRAALRGGWLTSLVTDARTARFLVEQP